MHRVTEGLNYYKTLVTSMLEESLTGVTSPGTSPGPENYSVSSTSSSSSSLAIGQGTATTELEENFYAEPVNDSALTSEEEIERTIETVKRLVLETEAGSKNRHKHVKRLIELRLKLQDIKEVTEETINSSHSDLSHDELKIVQNHNFILQNQPLQISAQYCDRCAGVIWTVLQCYYKCKGCSYQCHTKCLNQVVRNCQALKVASDVEYIQNICPEKGLPSQNYNCAECKEHFTLKNAWVEPRLDDYDGKYYCPLCHFGRVAVIPARVFRNWDFEERRVSDASKQFLTLMLRKPNVNLNKINSKLFGFVEELNAVKRIREDIIIMKEYFMTCREASNKRMLLMLTERQHFVENSFMYSMQDLIDVNNGTLLTFLNSVYETFMKHIKENCEACRGKGFICEICENVQIIFPFDSGIHQCSNCHAVFHNNCFAKRESCPKCLRLNVRQH